MAEIKHKRHGVVPQDLSGKTFGNLTVLSLMESPDPKSGRYKWSCRCSCGNLKSYYAANLKSGVCTHCGCKRLEKPVEKHGRCYSPEYQVWRHMIERCNDKKNKSYPNYGGRGIAVCKQWQESFAAFFGHMGERPSPHHQIDRIDNSGNYEPGNCRWALRKIQARNQRSNRMVTFRGECLCLAEWAERTGISFYVLRLRIVRYKWDAERALTTLPLHSHYAPRKRPKGQQSPQS